MALTRDTAIAQIRALLAKTQAAGCTKSEETAAKAAAARLTLQHGIRHEELQGKKKPAAPPIAPGTFGLVAFLPFNAAVETPEQAQEQATLVEALLRTAIYQQDVKNEGSPLDMPRATFRVGLLKPEKKKRKRK